MVHTLHAIHQKLLELGRCFELSLHDTTEERIPPASVQYSTVRQLYQRNE